MKRNAFGLIELLCVLFLISAAAVVIARLSRSAMRVINDAPVRQDEIGTFEHAMSRLRADVWSAESIDIRDGVLALKNAESVQWRAESDELVRQCGDEVLRWPGAARDIQFEKSASGVRLRNGIVLVSELQLLEQMR